MSKNSTVEIQEPKGNVKNEVQLDTILQPSCIKMSYLFGKGQSLASWSTTPNA